MTFIIICLKSVKSVGNKKPILTEKSKKVSEVGIQSSELDITIFLLPLFSIILESKLFLATINSTKDKTKQK